MMQDDDKLELDDLDDVLLDDEDFDLDDENFEDLDLEELDDVDLEPDSSHADDAFDDDFSDDDWEDEEFSDVDGSHGQEAKANKTLIYGILAVFGFVFAFVGWKALSPMLSGGAAPQISAPVDVAQQGEQEADVLDGAPPMPVPVANVDAEDDVVSALPDVSNDSVSQNSSALTPLPTMDDMDGGDMPSLPSLDMANSQPSPAPVMDLPTSATMAEIQSQKEVDSMPVVRDVLPKESDIVSPVASPVVSTVSDKDLDKIREASVIVEGKVEGIEDRLDRYDDVLSEIMASLKRIEGDMQAQSQEIEAVKKAAASVKAVKTVPKKKTTAPKKAVVKKKTPILYDSESVVPKKTVKKAVARPKSWVLKSAQPGKAVVAEVGTRYLRSVEVGMTLSGVGRITSISNQSGRWIVQGTQGKVTQ